MNQIADIKKWFELAVPEPTNANKCVQIGCHFEEVSEMADSLMYPYLCAHALNSADGWKQAAQDDWETSAALTCVDERELLDALCDQIVTAVGVAHMFGFDIIGALAEVNRSNFSKFVDGKPVFNEQGKIAKPPSYSPPVLDPFLGK